MYLCILHIYSNLLCAHFLKTFYCYSCFLSGFVYILCDIKSSAKNPGPSIYGVSSLIFISICSITSFDATSSFLSSLPVLRVRAAFVAQNTAQILSRYAIIGMLHVYTWTAFITPVRKYVGIQEKDIFMPRKRMSPFNVLLSKLSILSIDETNVSIMSEHIV